MNLVRFSRRVCCLFLLPILLVSCGRYGPPVAPELVAPEAVGALSVRGTLEGVAFNWRAPESDQRGRALTSLDGYRIYRKPVSKASDALELAADFEAVGTIADTSHAALERAREEARAAGKPSRRVQIPDAERQFSFVDNGVQPGKTYLYKVVPFNQGGIETNSFQLVKVLWRGEASDIKTVDRSTIDIEEEFEEE